MSRCNLSQLAWVLAAVCGAVLPSWAVAGSLRVGPTRLDLSARHPVAVLEVQNTADSATLAQVDTFFWTQRGGGDLLEPTTELVATPLVLNLAPGETHLVRVGLREPNRSPVERSYRLFVREVAPASVPGSGLRFAVRIGVPVFALPADMRPGGAMPELSWRWIPDIEGCASVQISNPSERHDRVLSAQMLSRAGEVLWQASEPAYLLPGSRRLLLPALCAPSLKESATLRLVMEGYTVNLAVQTSSLVVDAQSP